MSSIKFCCALIIYIYNMLTFFWFNNFQNCLVKIPAQSIPYQMDLVLYNKYILSYSRLRDLCSLNIRESTCTPLERLHSLIIIIFNELTSVHNITLAWCGDNSIYSNYPYNIRRENLACRFRGLTA